MNRRRLLTVLSLVLLAAVIGGGAFAWNHQRRQARLEAIVAQLPELADRPAELRERLAAAASSIRSGDDPGAALITLGQLAHANDLTATAEACWRLLMREQPAEGRWPYLLADLHQSAGDQTGATELLKHSVELAPTYAPAWLKLADLHLKLGQLPAAESAYRRRLVLLPEDPYARLGLVRIALQAGAAADARTHLDTLLAHTSDFAPARNLLAELLAADGDAAAAAHERARGKQAPRFREADDPWLDELIDHCFDYDRLCVRGMTDALTHHGDRGEALFKRAIQLRPQALTAHELLGNVYLDRGYGTRAAQNYETALRVADDAPTPPPTRLFVSLARAYLTAERTADAVAAARRGLANSVDSFELLHILGNALRAQGELEEAVRTLETAATRQPNHAAVQHDLALVLLDQHRIDDAVAALHRAHAADPDFPPTLALLGQIEIDSGRWQNALSYLQPLFDAQPDVPAARQQMVHVLLSAGRQAEGNGELETAGQHYRQAAEIAPANPEPHARQGLLLLGQQRFAEAIPPLETFHRLQPTGGRSALFLGQACAGAGRNADARAYFTLGAELARQAGDQRIAQQCLELLAHLKHP